MVPPVALILSALDGAMQVKDPVCGMMIEESAAAAHGTYDGRLVYFCCEGCRRTYERTHPGRTP